MFLLDSGEPWSTIKRELRCDSRFISTWGMRFAEDRLSGLFGRHRERAPKRDVAKTEARVLECILKRKPRDGSTHWSSRKLAAEVKLPFMAVQRIWRKHDIRPHRLERHMVSNDPDFETLATEKCAHPLESP